MCMAGGHDGATGDAVRASVRLQQDAMTPPPQRSFAATQPVPTQEAVGGAMPMSGTELSLIQVLLGQVIACCDVHALVSQGNRVVF